MFIGNYNLFNIVNLIVMILVKVFVFWILFNKENNMLKVINRDVFNYKNIFDFNYWIVFIVIFL